MEATLERPRSRPRPRRPASVGPGGFRLGRLAGIELRAHVSWLAIVALIVLSLHAEFTVRHPALSELQRWSAATFAAGFFFGSIVLHELAHSLVAKARGIGVSEITLFVFGGVSRMKGEARRPGDEFLVALVGPVLSGVLGAAFLGAGRLLAAGSLQADVFHWLGRTNLALAVFNLLPGFPLDGGRVFRAVAWRWTGSLRKATQYAAMAGVLVADLLVVLGVVRAMGSGWAGDGLWLVLIGFFLLSAAKTSLPQHDFHEMLGRLRAADAMDVSFAFVSPEEPLEDLVEERLLRDRKERFVVEDETGILGLITVEDLAGIPRDQRRRLAARDVMGPLDGDAGVGLDTPLLEAIETMDDLRVSRLAVLENGVLRGVLTRDDIARRTALHLQLRGPVE